MAVPQSQNIERVKKSNQKEEFKMRQEMNELQRQRQQLLDNLQKEQLRMVHQVKANRIRELRQTLRQGLGMEEQVNMMRQKVFPGSVRNRSHMRQPQVKGFSRVDIEEEDDDDVYAEYLQQRHSPKLHVLQARWVKRREREEAGKENKEPEYDISDDEIFLRYPCKINENTHGVISLRDLTDLQKNRFHSRFKTDEKFQSVTLQRSRYPLPKYVSQLQRLDGDYDEFTDGAMALEVRRFKQKQRERTPVPVGFLPVRRRYIDEFDYLYDENNRQSSNVASSAPAMSIHGKAPAQVRVYLPKSPEEKPQSEEQEEHHRLLKLRKADQADLYQDSIQQTSAFLGNSTKHHRNLIPKESLSREETIMLDQLKRVPAFRSGSKMVSAPVSRYTRSEARTCASKNSQQIRNIMNYVLTKDYTDTGSATSGPPPPNRLDYDSEESD